MNILNLQPKTKPKTVKAKRFRLVLGDALVEARPLVSHSQQYPLLLFPLTIVTIFALGIGLGYMLRGDDGVVATPKPAALPTITVTNDTPPAIPFAPPPDTAADNTTTGIQLPIPDIHMTMHDDATGGEMITGNKSVDDLLRSATRSRAADDMHLSVTSNVAAPTQSAEEESEENTNSMADPTDITSLRTRVKQNPHDDTARHDLADILAQDSSFDALAELQKMARAAPDDAVILAAMAQFLARHQDVDTAIYHMTRAIRLNPADLNYRFTLAVLYDRKGRPEKALTLYQQIIQAAPDLGETNVRLPMASIRARARYLASEVADNDGN